MMSFQIKDPAAEELRYLAEEALDGVDYGEEPQPEKYLELVFGAEIVELKGFVGEIKVCTECCVETYIPEYYCRYIIPGIQRICLAGVIDEDLTPASYVRMLSVRASYASSRCVPSICNVR